MSAPVRIDRKTLATGAVKAWRSAYGTDGGGYGEDKVRILKELRALGPSPRPDAVDAVIGNNSWTRVPECDGCGRENNAFVIRVGDEPDYESSTAHLCKRCVARVAALAELEPQS